MYKKGNIRNRTQNGKFYRKTAVKLKNTSLQQTFHGTAEDTWGYATHTQREWFCYDVKTIIANIIIFLTKQNFIDFV